MSASLKGKTIAFSGPFMEHGAKRDAILKAIKAGATVSPNISKNVDIVFRGDAKLSKPSMGEVVAKYNGTKVLSANSFMNFVRSGGAARMNKVADAMKHAAASKSAAPVPVKAAGRLRAVAPPSVRKTATVASVATRRGRKTDIKKAALAPVSLSAIYQDKTAAEIAAMEEEAAKFGPMPWEKKSKFNLKQEKLAALRKARAEKRAGKTSSKKAVEAAPKSDAAAATADAPATSSEAETAVISADGESNTITFTPSKGLSVTFTGDFNEFCRVAAQLSNPAAAAASAAAVEQAPAPAAVPEATVVEAAKPETPKAKEGQAEKQVEEKAAKSAAPSAKKAASAPKKVTKSALLALKKVAPGRARRVVTSKTAAASENNSAGGTISLKKKVVSFTGTFFQMKRLALQALATKSGAVVATGIAGDIDYLIVGADAANKKKAAKKLGIPTISEKAFLASCGSK